MLLDLDTLKYTNNHAHAYRAIWSSRELTVSLQPAGDVPHQAAQAQQLPFSSVCLLLCADDLLILTVEGDCHKHLSGQHVAWAMTRLGCLCLSEF